MRWKLSIADSLKTGWPELVNELKIRFVYLFLHVDIVFKTGPISACIFFNGCPLLRIIHTNGLNKNRFSCQRHKYVDFLIFYSKSTAFLKWVKCLILFTPCSRASIKKFFKFKQLLKRSLHFLTNKICAKCAHKMNLELFEIISKKYNR